MEASCSKNMTHQAPSIEASAEVLPACTPDCSGLLPQLPRYERSGGLLQANDFGSEVIPGAKDMGMHIQVRLAACAARLAILLQSVLESCTKTILKGCMLARQEQQVYFPFRHTYTTATGRTLGRSRRSTSPTSPSLTAPPPSLGWAPLPEHDHLGQPARSWIM